MSSELLNSEIETRPSVVWFRRDLRVHDNPALDAAIKRGAPIVCVFVPDGDANGPWRAGGASRWWLHHSLAALSADLRARGGDLLLRCGASEESILSLVEEIGAGAVYWNRRYDGPGKTQDQLIKSALKAGGVIAESFNGALLLEPWEVSTKDGRPYRVFTPFWKALRTRAPFPRPLAAPEKLPSFGNPPRGEELADWSLTPSLPDWAKGFVAAWSPGEEGAERALDRFLAEAAQSYKEDRDRPDRIGTSCLSPHLAFGEISPRRIWTAAAAQGDSGALHPDQAEKFLSEIAWREFSYSLLHFNEDLPDACLQEKFNAFPWENDPKNYDAWTKGQTGYPLVDAGMRQLWATGWMHNRVRMVAASFLIKHLLVDWRRGAEWFWDTLVDADLANNSASWQWVAGCGADAAPFFRIFNPIAQGTRFDPEGDYVRRWVPEISDLPAKYIHAPWTAPESVLNAAEVRLGATYPFPIVDHKFARERALAAFKAL